ncbi:fibronectin type III domain-containing protein [Streptomyces sp. NBC_01381]|uniref:fibronectin type III domain-containing protein n=1 Tax=Streptomyces sp. NBC_01381 TaxID=2903845 RepID=UPI00224E0310|nr:fibronectin type III domain-containing protein [Streptomyces sp. NBC_01381]MCX4669153.1 fibronectin type III domain-containing protein [Streptomyces sp. NBC_01381]
MRRTPHLTALLAVTAVCALSSCAWQDDPSDSKDVAPPAAPRGVTVQAGSATTAHVMWNRATDDTGVTGYDVYRGATRVERVPGGKHMVDVTGLQPSTTYAFTVRARDAEGNVGPASKKLSVTTPGAAAADHEPPSRPGTPRGAAEGSRAVTLSWGASSDDQGVASYEIYQGTAKIHSVERGERTTLITGLRPGTTYTFTVKARDAADNFSSASRAVRLTTAPGRDDGRGTAPTGFRATTHRAGGAYYIDLSWTPPRTGGAVSEYQIHLDGKAATSLVFGGTAPRTKATHSFYLGKEPGERHRVKLRARLPDGAWGGYSAERAVTTGRPS